jgi:hypothetical protein
MLIILLIMFASGAVLQLGADQPKKMPWMSGVSSAKIESAPMDRNLKPGEIVRIEIREGRAWEIFIGSGGRIYAFKGSEPVVHVDNGMGKYQVYVTAQEADYLVLYDEGGRGAVARVKEAGIQEQVLSAGDQMQVTGLIIGEELFARFVKLSSGNCTFVYTFLRDGEPMPENEIGPEKFRTTTLDGPGETRELEFRSPSDTMVVEVREGKAVVKAGQPFE